MDIDLKEMGGLIRKLDADGELAVFDTLSDWLWENKEELFRLAKLGEESEKSSKSMKKYYFTFGSGHSPGIGHYLVIEAEDSASAREIMYERWGLSWCTNYDSAEAAGVEKYGLKEVTVPDRSEWEGA